MNNNPNTINNDNDYMEFSKLMKDQYDELKKENKNLKKHLFNYQKEICSIYGIMRVIDFMISDLHNIPNVLIELIERQRSALSRIVEKDIIKYIDEDEEEEQEEEELIVQLFVDNLE